MGHSSIVVADNFWKRLKGATFTKGAFTPLFFPRCQSIHTCFMHQNIDLHWVDNQGQIIRKDINVKPWRLKQCAEAFGVIEVSSHKSQTPTTDYRPPSNITDYIKNTSGQSLVEFALLLPILILLIFGFLQLSLAIKASLKLQHVTFYATTVGSLTNDDQKITGAIENFYEPDELDITIENKNSAGGIISSSDRRYGDELSLKLVHNYPIQIPYLTLTQLDLQSIASSRILCQSDIHPYTCE